MSFAHRNGFGYQSERKPIRIFSASFPIIFFVSVEMNRLEIALNGFPPEWQRRHFFAPLARAGNLPRRITRPLSNSIVCRRSDNCSLIDIPKQWSPRKDLRTRDYCAKWPSHPFTQRCRAHSDSSTVHFLGFLWLISWLTSCWLLLNSTRFTPAFAISTNSLKTLAITARLIILIYMCKFCSGTRIGTPLIRS